MTTLTASYLRFLTSSEVISSLTIKYQPSHLFYLLLILSMKNHAKVELFGRVVKKADIQKSKNDKDFTRLTIAVNLQDEPNYYTVVGFNGISSVLSNLEKGQLVLIQGNLQVNVSETKDGKQRTELTVFVEKVYPYQSFIKDSE